MKKIICSIWLSFASLVLFSQGSLLLVGGGIELEGGWSDTPYKWFVDQAPNQRIAILSSTPSVGDRLADYFLELGATSTRNFYIYQDQITDSPWIYDSLMQYDAIFLSRADISFYYEKLEGGPIQRAIKDKFKGGGAIGGSAGGCVILGELFLDESKEKASLYELTTAMASKKLAIYKDFLSLLPNYIIEGEFSEKGHLISAISNISHQWRYQNTHLKGIGIDEKTAICIDTQKKGRIYGLAAVHFLLPSEDEPEYKSATPFFSNSTLRHLQLLQGSTFDFRSNKVQGLNSKITPVQKEEIPEQQVLLSGSNAISENIPFFQALINKGELSAPIIIISGADSTLIETLTAVLSSLGAGETTLISTKKQTQPKALINKFGQTSKILFFENELRDLLQFLSKHTYGETNLLTNLQKEDRVLAFAGDDAPFAGKSVVTNYEEKWASYEGNLTFEEGLGVLSATTIMANAFSEPDYLDNIMTGIPYTMVKDSLLYGLWLYSGSYVACGQENGIISLKSYGDNPTILLKNPGIQADFAPTYRGSNRNIVAFDAMQLSLVDDAGVMLGLSQTEAMDTANIKEDWLTVYPNPVKDKLNVLFYGNQVGRFILQLKDGNGRTLLSKSVLVTTNQSVIEIDVSKIPKGIHALSILQGQKRMIKKLRVIK